MSHGSNLAHSGVDSWQPDDVERELQAGAFISSTGSRTLSAIWHRLTHPTCLTTRTEALREISAYLHATLYEPIQTLDSAIDEFVTQIIAPALDRGSVVHASAALACIERIVVLVSPTSRVGSLERFCPFIMQAFGSEDQRVVERAASALAVVAAIEQSRQSDALMQFVAHAEAAAGDRAWLRRYSAALAVLAVATRSPHTLGSICRAYTAWLLIAAADQHPTIRELCALSLRAFLRSKVPLTLRSAATAPAGGAVCRGWVSDLAATLVVGIRTGAAREHVHGSLLLLTEVLRDGQVVCHDSDRDLASALLDSRCSYRGDTEGLIGDISDACGGSGLYSGVPDSDMSVPCDGTGGDDTVTLTRGTYTRVVETVLRHHEDSWMSIRLAVLKMCPLIAGFRVPISAVSPFASRLVERTAAIAAAAAQTAPTRSRGSVDEAVAALRVMRQLVERLCARGMYDVVGPYVAAMADSAVVLASTLWACRSEAVACLVAFSRLRISDRIRDALPEILGVPRADALTSDDVAPALRDALEETFVRALAMGVRHVPYIAAAISDAMFAACLHVLLIDHVPSASVALPRDDSRRLRGSSLLPCDAANMVHFAPRPQAASGVDAVSAVREARAVDALRTLRTFPFRSDTPVGVDVAARCVIAFVRHSSPAVRMEALQCLMCPGVLAAYDTSPIRVISTDAHQQQAAGTGAAAGDDSTQPHHDPLSARPRRLSVDDDAPHLGELLMHDHYFGELGITSPTAPLACDAGAVFPALKCRETWRLADMAGPLLGVALRDRDSSVREMALQVLLQPSFRGVIARSEGVFRLPFMISDAVPAVAAKAAFLLGTLAATEPIIVGPYLRSSVLQALMVAVFTLNTQRREASVLSLGVLFASAGADLHIYARAVLSVLLVLYHRERKGMFRVATLSTLGAVVQSIAPGRWWAARLLPLLVRVLSYPPSPRVADAAVVCLMRVVRATPHLAVALYEEFPPLLPSLIKLFQSTTVAGSRRRILRLFGFLGVCPPHVATALLDDTAANAVSQVAQLPYERELGSLCEAPDGTLLSPLVAEQATAATILRAVLACLHDRQDLQGAVLQTVRHVVARMGASLRDVMLPPLAAGLLSSVAARAPALSDDALEHTRTLVFGEVATLLTASSPDAALRIIQRFFGVAKVPFWVDTTPRPAHPVRGGLFGSAMHDWHIDGAATAPPEWLNMELVSRSDVVTQPRVFLMLASLLQLYTSAAVACDSRVSPLVPLMVPYILHSINMAGGGPPKAFGSADGAATYEANAELYIVHQALLAIIGITPWLRASQVRSVVLTLLTAAREFTGHLGRVRPLVLRVLLQLMKQCDLTGVVSLLMHSLLGLLHDDELRVEAICGMAIVAVRGAYMYEQYEPAVAAELAELGAPVPSLLHTALAVGYEQSVDVAGPYFREYVETPALLSEAGYSLASAAAVEAAVVARLQEYAAACLSTHTFPMPSEARRLLDVSHVLRSMAQRAGRRTYTVGAACATQAPFPRPTRRAVPPPATKFPPALQARCIDALNAQVYPPTTAAWGVWRDRLACDLIDYSPSPLVWTVSPLARMCSSVAVDLLPLAFVLAWGHLPKYGDTRNEFAYAVVAKLELASSDVRQTILMALERAELWEAALPIPLLHIAGVATDSSAIAKAVRWSELAFEAAPTLDAAGQLVSAIALTGELDASRGALSRARELLGQPLEHTYLYERVGDWVAALRSITAREDAFIAAGGLEYAGGSERRAQQRVHVCGDVADAQPGAGADDEGGCCGWVDCCNDAGMPCPADPRERQEMMNGYVQLRVDKLRCLSQLSEWGEVTRVAASLWETGHVDAVTLRDVRAAVAPYASRAAWHAGEWAFMRRVVPVLPPVERGIAESVISINDERYADAMHSIERARDALASDLVALLREGYARAYETLTAAQLLSELEEAIELRIARARGETEVFARLQHVWDHRAQAIDDVTVLESVMFQRLLALPASDSLSGWLRVVDLHRAARAPDLERKTLHMLMDLPSDGVMSAPLGPQVVVDGYRTLPPQVALAYIQHLYDYGGVGVHAREKSKLDAVTALSDLTNLYTRDVEASPVSLPKGYAPPSLPFLAQCYSLRGMWCKDLDVCLIEDSNVAASADPAGVRDMRTATQLNPAAAYTWRALGNRLFDIVRFHETSSEQRAPLLAEALKALFNAIQLGWRDATVLQDVLRVLTLWFDYGKSKAVSDDVEAGLRLLPTRTWLAVTPQIIARLSVRSPRIREGVSSLLLRIGTEYPEAVVYSLIVHTRADPNAVYDAQDARRRRMARRLVDSLSRISPAHASMVRQASIVAEELVRCSCFVDEAVAAYILEASQAHQRGDVAAVVGILRRVAAVIMNQHPRTPREVPFWQRYGRDIVRAWELISSVTKGGVPISVGRAADTSPTTDADAAATAAATAQRPLRETRGERSSSSASAEDSAEDPLDAAEGRAVAAGPLQQLRWEAAYGEGWALLSSVYRSIEQSHAKESPEASLHTVSPRLAALRSLNFVMPRLPEEMVADPLAGGDDVGRPVTVERFGRTLSVISSKHRPRRMSIYGSDGVEYQFLLKAHEDLRLDERMMQLFGLVNALLQTHDTRARDLEIARYPVVPLSGDAGLIGWVDGCDTLNVLITSMRSRNNVARYVDVDFMLSGVPDGSPEAAVVLQGARMNEWSKQTAIQRIEAFTHACGATTASELSRAMWMGSASAEVWLTRRQVYSRSVACTSMVGYLIGLGDRHPNNIMLTRSTGRAVHIDFGDSFEVASKREKFPEVVPFRLTRMMGNALELGALHGSFTASFAAVNRLLRSNADSLTALLYAFVHDPLISWRLTVPAGQAPKAAVTHEADVAADSPDALADQGVPIETRLQGRSLHRAVSRVNRAAVAREGHDALAGSPHRAVRPVTHTS